MLSILVVDDEQDLLDLAVQYLAEPGVMEVLTAPSVDAALFILATKPVDAIVSDYEMPDKDGIAFLQHLRSRGSTVPFIIFTGKGREIVAMQALNYGADFYLQKGSHPDTVFLELRNMITTAVERRRAVAEAEALAQRIEHQAQILDEILSSIPDPVLIIDPDGFITYANLVGARVLGFSRMAILGKHLRELRVAGEAVDLLSAAAEKVVLTGEKNVVDIPWDGSLAVQRYRCSISPLHTTTGRINAVDVIFTDITNEVRMAEELRHCRTEVNALLDVKKTINGASARKET